MLQEVTFTPMEHRNVHHILKTHRMRVTACRVDVLKSFIDEVNALSQGFLENKFPTYDRVTIYRTLNSFLEKGILHKIPNDQGTATFGLCQDNCTPTQHHHDHIHFKCQDCGKITCLEDMEIPKVNLPAGYSVSQVNMIVDGICEKCA